MRKIVYSIIIGIGVLLGVDAFSQDVHEPQVHNNLAVAIDLSDKWSIYNQVSYNVLISQYTKWNEFALFSMPSYLVNKNIEAIGGLYLGYVDQNDFISSIEFRPFIGIRFLNTMGHRFVISNTSRLEFRYLYYSDEKVDFTLRFRNRTDLLLSIIKPKMNMDKNLFLFAHGEIFYNFEANTRERFYNLFKVKLGLGYRLNYHWRFTTGVIYQDSELNIGQPTNLPTNVVTDLIFEWRMLYFISAIKARD